MNPKTLLTLGVLVALQSFAARPIARWDVIPNQRFDHIFKAGVCAFHKAGVRVEFSTNGILCHTTAKPEFNERTGVWEYVLPLNAAAFPDGPVTISAKIIALDVAAETHNLPDLTLFANAKGSLSVHEKLYVDSSKGNDTADGTKIHPLKTLAAVRGKLRNGGTVPSDLTVLAPIGQQSPRCQVSRDRRLQFREAGLPTDFDSKMLTFLPMPRASMGLSFQD